MTDKGRLNAGVKTPVERGGWNKGTIVINCDRCLVGRVNLCGGKRGVDQKRKENE